MPLVALAAVGIGASLIKAKVQSNAANKAAELQQASAVKAQGYNQQVYGEQQRLMAPYVNAGNESLARLMSQHWGTPYQQPPPFTPQGPMNPNTAVQRFGGQPQAPHPGSRPRPTTLGGMQQQQIGPQGGGMVQMQAPDGSVQAVPPQVVAQLEQRGARRL